jgi:hypothetical protein
VDTSGVAEGLAVTSLEAAELAADREAVTVRSL